MAKKYFILLILFVAAFSANAGTLTFYGGELSGESTTLQLGEIYFLLTPPPPPAVSEATAQEATPEAIAAPETIITAAPTTEAATTSTTTTSTTTSTGTTTTTLLPEASPEIKVWIDNRLYQKDLVDKGEEFISSARPKIRLEAKIPEPYVLSQNVNNFTISLDPGAPNAKTIAAKTSVSQMAATHALSIEYILPDDLAPGRHELVFSAKSGGTKGMASPSTLKAYVTVKSGPASVVGEVIHFPSPYSPTKNRGTGMTLQYTLTANTDIDIYVFSIAGEIVKKITCMSGTEGGTAGLNKVKWDGALDSGGVIGNGMYVATLVSKTEGKLLKKFKINVFD